MFNRLIINDLVKWKESTTRKPLLLRGARQVGKTSVVHQFGKSYKQYIYLNLELDQSLFAKDTDFDKLVASIFFLKNQKISLSAETLIFIDEIQELPYVINLLRYFFEKYPQIHVIAAGSLLEMVLSENVSFPVGRIQFMVMRPFCFEEYLLAIGEINLVQALHNLEQFDYATTTLFEHFHTYTLVGGMPEILANYVVTKDVIALQSVYANLVEAYMNDIPKYARNSSMVQVLRHCMQHIFYFGGKRIAYVNFGGSSYKSREVSEALQALQKAMLLHVVFPSTNETLPLVRSFKRQPKLFLLDTGLMNFMAGLQTQVVVAKDLNDVYAGQVAEQIVAQEMASTFTTSLQQHNFWINSTVGSDAEVDFILQIQGLVIPVEVKSGKIGKLKSLLQFMDLAPHRTAVRLYRGPILVHEAITPKGKAITLINLPYFLAAYIPLYVQKYWQNN
ncbi:MAG: hypothetical protein RL660_144 [Bacteroidota bacterium]|jgi:predicted AAA+ superfamily ATPase